MRSAGNRSKGRTRRGVAVSALLLLAAAAPPPAGGVLVDIQNTYSGVVGDTLDVFLETEDLTGLGVTAFEFEVTWTAGRLTLIDVDEAGTLSAPFGPPTFSTTANGVLVATAGASALAGSGNLLVLRFLLGPNPGSTSLVFQSFLFNEGSPPATTSNGSVSIAAPPSITVFPSSGELVVSETLAFGVSGGTAPFLWGTTDAGVATIDAAGLLTGTGPGAVRVFAEDAAGVRDTTDSDILVRAMRLSVPDDVTAAPGAAFTIPVDVTDVTGLGLTSYEIEMSWALGRFSVVGVTTAGTLAGAAGWGAPEATLLPGRVVVAAAGTSPLAGSGPLVILDCVADPAPGSPTTLDLTEGLFDELFPAVLDDGLFSPVLSPTITVSPNTAEVFTGDSQPFTVGGSPTPPFVWGVTDPAVATIDGAGVLTGLSGGTCRVFVEDAAGARDTTSTIDVFDFRLFVPPTVVELATASTAVPVSVDRELAPFGVYGYELTLSFDRTRVHALAVTDSGSVSAAWGTPTFHLWADSVRIAHAGSAPLSGSGPLLHVLFEVDAAASQGQTSTLAFRRTLFNEGVPRAKTQDGTLTVDDTITGIRDPRPGEMLVLSGGRPNPFGTRTTLAFSLASSAGPGASLTIHDAAGRVIRRFSLAGAREGPHVVRWDGRDRGHRAVANGVYFVRLSALGQEHVRKIVRLR